MALTCARCGTQNPDGNLYCQTCGTPLAMAASPAPTPAPPPPPPGLLAGPPPGMAPPAFSPSGYQSPYYAPTGPTVPVHRAPLMLIIAGVVAMVVLLAGFGTAFAVLANHGAPGGSNPGVGDLPSPTPASSVSPVASPTSTPTYGATTASNNGLSVPVPQGWSVTSQDTETIVLSDPKGEGSISLGSGPSSPVQTAQENKNTIDSYLKNAYPDARICPNTSAKNTAFNGASGISWTACFTLTGGSSAVPAAASIFAGANSSGSVYYVVMVLTRQDNLQSYLNAARPMLQGVQWKLT